MNEELNVFAIYAIQCAVIGLFCTMIAYVANWIETHYENMKGLKGFINNHIHFNHHPHLQKINRKTH